MSGKISENNFCFSRIDIIFYYSRDRRSPRRIILFQIINNFLVSTRGCAAKRTRRIRIDNNRYRSIFLAQNDIIIGYIQKTSEPPFLLVSVRLAVCFPIPEVYKTDPEISAAAIKILAGKR